MQTGRGPKIATDRLGSRMSLDRCCRAVVGRLVIVPPGTLDGAPESGMDCTAFKHRIPMGERDSKVRQGSRGGPRGGSFVASPLPRPVNRM